MTDQRSVELLAFKFSSGTFAYRRLAQGLSRALSAFSSFLREYLDSVIKADQCAQYVDDIGIAASTTKQLIQSIRAVFKCIREAGLKLTIEKCHFEVTQVEFFGRTITPEGVAPQDQKVKTFLSKVHFPKSKKEVQKDIGFVNYYQNYIPRLSETLIGMYGHFKADAKIRLSEEVVDSFKEIKPSGSLWIGTTTARSCKTIRPHHRLEELPCIRLCTHDRKTMNGNSSQEGKPSYQ